MFLIIVGILVFLFKKSIGNVIRNYPKIAYKTKLVSYIAFAIILFGLIFSTITQIDTGHVGIQSFYGQIQKRILKSGLNITNPLMDISELDVKTQNYTMSAVTKEGNKEGDDAIRVLTKDGLEVTIDLSVLFKVNETQAPYIVKNIGLDYIDKIVRPISRTIIRDNAVYYDAVELYSLKRDEFQVKVSKGIESEFSKRGLLLENILVRNISLPETVKKAIESKINAEQESEKMQFVLTKEKQEAERKRVEAQGIADYQKIINTGLTSKQLQYEQIKAYKEIATSDNSKVLIIPEKNNVMVTP